MKKVEMIKAVEMKMAEMEELLEELLNDPKTADTTKRTQKFQRNKTIHEMRLFDTILQQCGDEISLCDDEQKWFNSMVTLTSVRKAKYTVEVHEGDRISELLQKYSEMNDVYKKLMKAADEAGLKANFTNDMFVKA